MYLINKAVILVFTGMLPISLAHADLLSSIGGGSLGNIGGGSIGSVVGGASSLFGNGFTMSSSSAILGDTGISIQCNPSIGSIDAPNIDVCRMTGYLDAIAGRNLAFKIGPCDLSGKNPLSCTATNLRRYCAERAGAPAAKVVSDVRKANRDIIDAGRQKVVITGGEEIAKDTFCGITPSPKEKVPEVSRAQNAVTRLNNSPSYGPIINSRMFRLTSECYEGMIKSGKSDAEATRYCSPTSIGSQKTGSTNADVDKASIKTAKSDLASPFTGVSAGAFMDEAQLRQWIDDACGESNSESSATSCAENVINNRYKMKEKTRNMVADIESKEAGRAYLFESASAHRKELTHPTEEYKNKLPVEMRRAYAGTARRAMAQQTLVDMFNRRISETKKELAKLMMQKTEMAAKPFFEKAESEKIKQELNNAGAN